MSKAYLPWAPFEPFLFPPSPTEWLPEGHLAWFMLELVDALDLRVIEGRIQSKDPRGQRPYPPQMMVALLLYAYCVGEPSSRQIERLTFEDIAFRVLAGGLHPDHKAISEFRRVHLTEFKDFFYQALELCKKAGLLKLGHVALDGTKIEANASAHKAMSYERMKTSEERLKQEIQLLLDRAEAVDTSEDKQYGAGGLGDWRLEGELERREARLAKIQQARKELEAEAAAARARVLSERAAVAAEKAAETPAEGGGVSVGIPLGTVVNSTPVETPEGRPGATGSQTTAGADKAEDEAASEKEAERRQRHAEKLRGQAEEAAEQARKAAAEAGMAAPDIAVREPDVPPSHQVDHTAEGLPAAKAQRNFTDSDSRIMKRGGEFIQAYNCQAVVESSHQLIVEIEVTNQAPDPEHLIPLLSKLQSNLGELPEKLSSDTGYWSDENDAWCKANNIDAYIAVGRDKHENASERYLRPESVAVPPAVPEKPPPKEQMAAKLKTAEGREVYSRRKVIVEPVFGQIKGPARRLERFLLRGLEKVQGEWALFCLTHNILKMFRAQ